MFNVIGNVLRVVGPLVEAQGVQEAQMLEMVEVGDSRLIGEIVHLIGHKVVIQVYEDTTSLKPGAPVYGSGMPLAVELGPGLISTIYDGIQRPLEAIRASSGCYIQKGIHLPALDRQKRWHFTPSVKLGDILKSGAFLGKVPETGLIEHRIMVPPGMQGTVTMIVADGDYVVEDTIAVLSDAGREYKLSLYQRWPVRQARPHAKKERVATPLITGQRVIDTLFPIAKGGAVVVPGGFGTGKTMVQHQLAKWCDADLIVFIGCGERGNEMTDVLLNFPRLIDPKSGKPLMERTIFVANTSNMPVAAREASIYTGITLAEYYRDMGYHVAVMADSTSRWAEALRELSGRMEEMPADEGFPAYLPTRLAEFYERAGLVKTLAGREGSITIIGSVSPPGGDFSEPVTQHSKRYVRCFWALDRDLANARHYPSISWLDSYSEYLDEAAAWWQANLDPDWLTMRNEIIELLQKEGHLQQVVKIVGPDVLPDSQKIILDICMIFKNAFLQQSAFDSIDTFSSPAKQVKMLRIIMTFYQRCAALIKAGGTMEAIKTSEIRSRITRMKFECGNNDIPKFDALLKDIEAFAPQPEKV